MSKFLKTTTLLTMLSLYGCQSTDEAPYVERPVEELYNEGRAHLNAGRYEKAAVAFDEVERQHPYSEWAVQAQLMTAYAYYLAQKYEKALTSIESFIALHPSHIDMPYALYLRGLCYYEQTSMVERDQGVTELALDAFRELVKKYPSTRYARDARIKIDLLLDHLAARDMDVGRYYQRRKAYTAAINRFKDVLIHYQHTIHVEEALHRLVESYIAIGMTDEARRAAVVLGHNFPGSSWYKDTFNLIQQAHIDLDNKGQPDVSWLNSIIFKQHAHPNQDLPASTEPHSNQSSGNNQSDELERPIERLKHDENYKKTEEKIEAERSSWDSLEDLFSKKPSKS